mgnify:CR=1 FL=1
MAVINRSAERTQLMTVAVLALQGAFAEHEKILSKLGADSFEIRQKKDLERSFDRLIIPGGESTVQGKLLRELDLFDGIKSRIEGGMPVYGTCAGLILLAKSISNDSAQHLQTMSIVANRNAYGRQLGSFHTEAQFEGIGEIPMTFIRAPYIASVGDGVEVLAVVEERIVGVKHKNQMAFSFHPELDPDVRIHKAFLKMI